MKRSCESLRPTQTRYRKPLPLGVRSEALPRDELAVSVRRESGEPPTERFCGGVNMDDVCMHVAYSSIRSVRHPELEEIECAVAVAKGDI